MMGELSVGKKNIELLYEWKRILQHLQVRMFVLRRVNFMTPLESTDS